MKTLVTLFALLLSVPAFAAQDCSKHNLQLSYNDMSPIRDILAGKITASTRMYSDRCERDGQVLEITFSADPVDGNGKRRPQARVLVKKVSSGLAFASLTDAMAKQQLQANAAGLRAFLATIYGKDKEGKTVDLAKESWTHIEFQLAR